MTAVQQFAELEPLAAAIRDDKLGDFRAASPLAACLMPLLTALKWRGSPRDIAEALPHVADTLDLVDLRNVLATLGYDSHGERTTPRALDARLLPCLFIPDRGGALVLVERRNANYRAFDGTANEELTLAPSNCRGTAYYFTDTSVADSFAVDQSTGSWFAGIANRFRPTVYWLLCMTLMLNLLALAVPLFIMIVYDKVIGAHSVAALPYLAGGIIAAMVCDIGLRMIRARVIGGIAGRLDFILGAEAFGRILSLPPASTERATIGAQVSRLREFESVREFFSGPLANVALELPFAPLFLAVIAVLAGPVALVPACMIGAFALFGWFWLPGLRDAVAAASRARAERQSFLVESLSHLRTVKTAAAEPIWSDRFRVLSARAVTANLATARRSVILQTVAHMLMVLAGVAVLGWGTLRVLDGVMSMGALIATMALVWRVLAPLQAGFLAFSRLEQVKLGIRQINQLMQLQPERTSGKSALLGRSFGGRVVFDRTSYRYAADADLALLGVTFSTQPGELVAITGRNGSGKSTLLKLVAGLYHPQGGTVTIDGLDLRQVDPMELRRSIAYVPQSPSLFHGTIAQNLRLADPTASDEQLMSAVAEAGLMHTILDLPDGFDTRVGDNAPLPYGFAQRLIIARALIRQAPILLLDEPATSLDEDGDRALMDLLERQKGRATIFMVSHRPSHIRLADNVIVLTNGIVQFDGRPDEVLALLHGDSA